MTNHEAITHGVFPAMITPFHDDGRIDHETLATEAQRLAAAGVDGLVPVGSTGEAATLTHAEHTEVVETVIEAVDDTVPVIAGTGSNNTQEALDLSAAAADAGADGVLLISPYYNKPEPAGMEAHFEAVADAVDLPQIIYNVPSRTGRNIALESVVSLANHENIVGLKAASGDINRISETVERTRDADFAVISGDDGVTFPLLSLGGTGVISVAANVAPEPIVEMVHAALDGDTDRARERHHDLGPLFRDLFIETNPIPVKEAVSMLGRCGPSLRPPLSRLSPQHRDHLETLLSEYQVLEARPGDPPA